MDNGRMAKKLFYNKVRRPRLRWLNDEEKDTKAILIKTCRQSAGGDRNELIFKES